MDGLSMKYVKCFLCMLLALMLACSARTDRDPEQNSETTESAAAASARPTPAQTREPTAAPSAAITPEAAATPLASNTPEPTEAPDLSPFSILWLPDTQTMSYYFPEKLVTLGENIAEKAETENLIAAIHTGDIVDNGFKSYQWENFDLCLNAFIDRIPFYPVAGNHDIAKPDSGATTPGNYEGYLEQPFLKRIPEEQLFEGGKMLYAVLNEGSKPVLLLGVGFETGKEPEELAWIDAALQSHADMPCILFVHGYESIPGRILRYCRYLEEDVVSKYRNIRFVLCGHARGYFYDVAEYDDDGDGVQERKVHVLMFNDQEGAFLYRIIRIDMENNTVAFQTYEVGTDRKIPDDPQFRQPADFMIENAF